MMAKSVRKRTTARIEKRSDKRTCTQTPHTTSASGTRATKDGVYAQFVMNWKLTSNPAQSLALNWEDSLNLTYDGVGGWRKQRMIRKRGGL